MSVAAAALMAPAAIAMAAQQTASAASVRFVYDDFDRFAEALHKVDAGAPAEATFQAYVDGAGPPYGFFKDRYGATGESMAAAVRKRPKHYRRVATLRSVLQSQERLIEQGVTWLRETFPDVRTPPVYFIVGNLTAGGIHAKLEPQVDGHETAPTLLVEALAMAPDTDMSEWPGRYSGGHLEDIAYVAVHEMTHVYQARLQGLANYVSIYQSGNQNNTYLALALREGCADYVTRLAIGRSRVGDQESYGVAHERELWAKFSLVADKPASFEDGWFGALDPKTPEWPTQIGYWVGQRMCQAYHESAVDKRAAVRALFAAYRAEDFAKIARPYWRQMDNRNPKSTR